MYRATLAGLSGTLSCGSRDTLWFGRLDEHRRHFELEQQLVERRQLVRFDLLKRTKLYVHLGSQIVEYLAMLLRWRGVGTLDLRLLNHSPAR